MSQTAFIVNDRHFFAESVQALPTNFDVDLNKYKSLYRVRAHWFNGQVTFYLGKWKGKREWHVWYANGSFHSSYGATMQKALEMAVRDAYMHLEAA